jgi:hypothetical protein
MIIKPIGRCKSSSLVFHVGKSWYYASNLDLLVTKSIIVGNRLNHVDLKKSNAMKATVQLMSIIDLNSINY